MSDIFIQIFQRKVIIQRSTFLEMNTLDVLYLFFSFPLHHGIHKTKIRYNVFQVLKVSAVFQWEPENKTKQKALRL